MKLNINRTHIFGATQGVLWMYVIEDITKYTEINLLFWLFWCIGILIGSAIYSLAKKE